MTYTVRTILLAGTALSAVALTTIQANAGAFALREQSAAGQGASFAGVAAGGALSSMFWNPAIMTQYSGKAIEMDVAGIIPNASHSFTTSSFAAFGTPGNSGISALVPSGYGSWQLTDNLWLGASLNAPVGLGVHFPQISAAASGSGNSAKVESYNFAPSVAYKINDMLSVSVGLQAQYLKASYDAFLGLGPNIGTLNGGSWNFGWTAGVTFSPLPRTQLGLGYRSGIDQKLSGTWAVPAALSPATQPGSVNLNLPLPATMTFGLRQGIGDRFTLLAGVEWANWSRIGTVPVTQPNGAPVTVGGAPLQFPFQYRDGWFFSLGGEYQLDPSWAVRAGIGFEQTPVTDNVRTTRIPDNDRIWYSVGASFKPLSMRGLTFDLGYSFIDVKNASVCMGPAASGCPFNPWSGATTYIGSVKSTINIVSLAVRYQWDAEPRRVR